MKTLYLGLLAVLCLSIPVVLHAQVKDSVDEKLKAIGGDVTKITVQTDKGEVTFEGDEAEYLLKKMKKKQFAFNIPDDLFTGRDFKDFDIRMHDFIMPHIEAFRHPGAEDISDDDLSINNFNKKITVDKSNGETKVTVKSYKDGDELIETYEGADAEKYLKEMNDEEPVSFDFKSKDKDDDKKETRIIIIK